MHEGKGQKFVCVHVCMSGLRKTWSILEKYKHTYIYIHTHTDISI